MVDGFLDVLEDIWPVLADTVDPIEQAPLLSTLLGMGVQEAFLAEQMDKTSGPLAMKFNHIESAASDSGPFLLGEQLTVADVFLFAAISWWGAGMLRQWNPSPQTDRKSSGRSKVSVRWKMFVNIMRTSKKLDKKCLQWAKLITPTTTKTFMRCAASDTGHSLN